MATRNADRAVLTFAVGFFLFFVATPKRQMRGFDFRRGRNASRLKPPATFAILASSRARYPSGKGEVCKTFIRGFDSHPRLQRFFDSVFLLIPAGKFHIEGTRILTANTCYERAPSW